MTPGDWLLIALTVACVPLAVLQMRAFARMEWE